MELKIFYDNDAKESFRLASFTTGELGNTLKEQSLIVQTENGLIVITGCSHPGSKNILRSASKFGKIYGVVGGFHGFSRPEVLKYSAGCVVEI